MTTLWINLKPSVRNFFQKWSTSDSFDHLVSDMSTMSDGEKTEIFTSIEIVKQRRKILDLQIESSVGLFMQMTHYVGASANQWDSWEKDISNIIRSLIHVLKNFPFLKLVLDRDLTHREYFAVIREGYEVIEKYRSGSERYLELAREIISNLAKLILKKFVIFDEFCELIENFTSLENRQLRDSRELC